MGGCRYTFQCFNEFLINPAENVSSTEMKLSVSSSDISLIFAEIVEFIFLRLFRKSIRSTCKYVERIARWRLHEQLSEFSQVREGNVLGHINLSFYPSVTGGSGGESQSSRILWGAGRVTTCGLRGSVSYMALAMARGVSCPGDRIGCRRF